MARAIRTAGLTLAVIASGTAVAAAVGGLEGAEQAAQPPSTRPPSTNVAVRATTEAPAGPVSARPDEVPRPSEAAAPSVDGAPDPVGFTRVAAQMADVAADRSPGWQERLGQAALAQLDYPWEALGYRIEFLPGRAGYLGMTFPERRTIEIYVRPGLAVDEIARNTAHEIGHAFDLSRNTPASRSLYLQLRGIEATGGWLACRGCTDLSTPAGDFAETFSFWLMDGAFPSRSQLGGGAPSTDDLRRLAPLFRLTAA
jgi:hypothetical protein